MLLDTSASRPTSASPPIVDATPWPRSPPSGPTSQTPAIYVKVNSFLSKLDLVNTLDGMLPHVGVLHVIRYKSHRGTGEKEPTWCMEEGRRRREEEEKEEEEEEGGTGRPAQRPVRPGHRPGAPRHRTGDQPDGNLRGFRFATGRPDP